MTAEADPGKELCAFDHSHPLFYYVPYLTYAALGAGIAAPDAALHLFGILWFTLECVLSLTSLRYAAPAKSIKRSAEGIKVNGHHLGHAEGRVELDDDKVLVQTSNGQLVVPASHSLAEARSTSTSLRLSSFVGRIQRALKTTRWLYLGILPLALVLSHEGLPKLGGALAAGLASLSYFVTFALSRDPRRIQVFADSLKIGEVTVPRSSAHRSGLRGGRLQVRTPAGVVRVPLQNLTSAGRQTLVDALHRLAQGAQEPRPYRDETFARGDKSAQEYIAHIRRSALPGMRTAALRPAAAVRALRARGASFEQRVGAAIALKTAQRKQADLKIRVAIKKTDNERIKRALYAVLHEDDEALAESLEA